MAHEVEIEGWRLGLIAGSWRYPDGDGYEPDSAWGELPDDNAGDLWVEGPGGVSATIAWTKGDGFAMRRMLDPRHAGDLGAFTVSTEVPPITRRNSQALLQRLMPSLRELVASRDIQQR